MTDKVNDDSLSGDESQKAKASGLNNSVLGGFARTTAKRFAEYKSSAKDNEGRVGSVATAPSNRHNRHDWLERLFDLFGQYAIEVNKLVEDAHLVTTCHRPGEGPSDNPLISPLQGCVSTKYWQLTVRLQADGIAGYLLPMSMEKTFLRDESLFERIFLIESPGDDNAAVWSFDNKPVEFFQLPDLAKRFFGSLIEIARMEDISDLDAVAEQTPEQYAAANTTPVIPDLPPIPSFEVEDTSEDEAKFKDLLTHASNVASNAVSNPGAQAPVAADASSAEPALDLAKLEAQAESVRKTNKSKSSSGDVATRTLDSYALLDFEDADTYYSELRLTPAPEPAPAPAAAPATESLFTRESMPPPDIEIDSTFESAAILAAKELAKAEAARLEAEKAELMAAAALIEAEIAEAAAAEEAAAIQREAEKVRAAEEARAEAVRALQARAELEARAEAEKAEQARLEEEARLEAERAEQARLEAEAAIEAERAEQARLEAEAAIEAERAEQARLEEEARLEAERAEQARLEEEARLEAERAEQARLEEEAAAEAERAEQARLEEEAAAEAERAEQARLEEEAAAEAERAEQARLEEAARAEAERAELAKLEEEAKAQSEEIREAARVAPVQFSDEAADGDSPVSWESAPVSWQNAEAVQPESAKAEIAESESAGAEVAHANSELDNSTATPEKQADVPRSAAETDISEELSDTNAPMPQPVISRVTLPDPSGAESPNVVPESPLDESALPSAEEVHAYRHDDSLDLLTPADVDTSATALDTHHDDKEVADALLAVTPSEAPPIKESLTRRELSSEVQKLAAKLQQTSSDLIDTFSRKAKELSSFGGDRDASVPAPKITPVTGSSDPVDKDGWRLFTPESSAIMREATASVSNQATESTNLYPDMPEDSEFLLSESDFESQVASVQPLEQKEVQGSEVAPVAQQPTQEQLAQIMSTELAEAEELHSTFLQAQRFAEANSERNADHPRAEFEHESARQVEHVYEAAHDQAPYSEPVEVTEVSSASPEESLQLLGAEERTAVHEVGPGPEASTEASVSGETTSAAEASADNTAAAAAADESSEKSTFSETFRRSSHHKSKKFQPYSVSAEAEQGSKSQEAKSETEEETDVDQLSARKPKTFFESLQSIASRRHTSQKDQKQETANPQEISMPKTDEMSVVAAIEMMRHSVERELENVAEVGSRAFQDQDMDTVERAMKRTRRIREFKEQLLPALEAWNTLGREES